MLTRSTLVMLLASGLALASHAGEPERARTLTFEQRVEAQRAIARVHYAYQIGAQRPFEEAVPDALLRERVRTYLRQSRALDRIWNRPVTRRALEVELRRIAAETHFPARLLELYAALGHDPLLVQETLVRPALVDRLARRLFARDREIHAAARARAEAFRRALAKGSRASAGPSGRVELELVRHATAGSSSTGPTRLELSSEELERWRRRLPARVGDAGDVVERDDAFVVERLLEETQGRLRIESYTFPKLSWDAWWADTAPRLSMDTAVAEPVASGLPAPLGGTCASEESWNNGILGDVPNARSWHTAVWTGTEMLIWGGTNGLVLSAGYRYDPVLETFTPISAEGAPEPRREHTAVWTGSEMIVWGGRNGYYPEAYDYLATGARYDPATDSWRALPTAGAPAPRILHTAVWTGSEMIVWGGTSDFGQNALASGGRYDPASDSWTGVSTAGAPTARHQHTAVWTGSRMIVWGGTQNPGGNVQANTGARYDPLTDSWTPTTTAGAPDGRYWHTAVWTGTRMIVWGGNAWGTGNKRSGSRYDPVADAWTPIPDAPVPGSGHTAVWTGSQMIVWRGSPYDGARYHLASNTWQLLPAPEEGARLGHASVWTGEEMIVWGGSTTNIGGRYDPQLDTWAPTSPPIHEPLGRHDHPAVWTGNLMLIWGGAIDPYRLADGARYDPLLDAWTPMSTTGQLGPRAKHSLVWTGEEMIVWGGDDLSPSSAGARYDPQSDSWTPTSTTGAPAPRFGHTAVWTGDEMMVWGGRNHSSFFGNGGRYDPATNAWISIATAGAPTPRHEHTSVWTGGAMIVWGGRDQTASHHTGGRYDPGADTWAPTAVAAAPAARHEHSAVWTGDEMIVWGGADATAALGTGGRYDPASNAWGAVGAAQAPQARHKHSAVWTGTEMVVWGGRNQQTHFDDGAIYDPATEEWTPARMDDAPVRREGHSAVWTGESMIVWGGLTDLDAVILDNGGRYSVPVDLDADGVADACDCAPSDAGSFSSPAEVEGLAFGDDKIILSWESGAAHAGPGLAYDVIRGSLGELPVGAGPSEECLATDVASTGTEALAVPPAGSGFYYLVRGGNACGSGTYGFDSSGSERLSVACP